MIAAICQNLPRSCFCSCFYNGLTLHKSSVGFHFSITLLRFSTLGLGEPQSSLHLPLYELLVHKHHFSPKSASHIASAVPRVRKPDKSDVILAFLKENGFSSSQLENLVTSLPQLISGNLETSIKPKIRIFQEFGISSSDAAEIITNHPDLLKYGANRLRPSFSALKTLFGSEESIELTRFLKAFGWFLKLNLLSGLVPNFNLLKNYVASVDQIRLLMHRQPRYMLRRPEEMKRFVDKLVELGFRRRSKMFIHGLRMLCGLSDETLELKKRTLREIGFSDDDIAETFRKNPVVFGYSEAKLKETKEVLLASGKYDLSCVVRYPISLSFSVEKRYKPRIQVLTLLEEKSLIQSWPLFTTFYAMTNKTFYDKYVAPFLDEIGDVNAAKSIPRG